MYEPLARALVAAAPVPRPAGWCSTWARAPAWPAGPRWPPGRARWCGPTCPRRCCGACGGGPHPVAADAVALPFRDRSFDLVLAAFCLNHLDAPDSGLAEARRVGAALAASTFAPGWTHPAKDAVEMPSARSATSRPRGTEALAPGARASDPEMLAGLAAAAGFTRVQVTTVAVPTGLATPAELAAWRLGMAHYAPFLHSLDAAGRAAVRRAAEQAVAAVTGAAPGPLVVSMVVLMLADRGELTGG